MIYIILITRHITKAIARIGSPEVQSTPAASEAIITANGLVVEAIEPILAPIKITPSGTNRSYPAAKKMGTNIG